MDSREIARQRMAAYDRALYQAVFTETWQAGCLITATGRAVPVAEGTSIAVLYCDALFHSFTCFQPFKTEDLMKIQPKLFRIGREGGTGSDKLEYVSGNVKAIEAIRARGVPRSQARIAMREAMLGASAYVTASDSLTVEVKWLTGEEPGDARFDVLLDDSPVGTVWGPHKNDALARAVAVYGKQQPYTEIRVQGISA